MIKFKLFKKPLYFCDLCDKQIEAGKKSYPWCGVRWCEACWGEHHLRKFAENDAAHKLEVDFKKAVIKISKIMERAEKK